MPDLTKGLRLLASTVALARMIAQARTLPPIADGLNLTGVIDRFRIWAAPTELRGMLIRGVAGPAQRHEQRDPTDEVAAKVGDHSMHASLPFRRRDGGRNS